MEAFNVPDEDLLDMFTSFHGAMGGALHDHFHPVTFEQSLFSAYGVNWSSVKF